MNVPANALQRGMLDWLLAVIIAVPVFLGLSFLEPEQRWDATPRSQQGRLVFEPHLELHPHHYGPAEEARMLQQVSLLRMSFDPRHLSTVPWFFRQQGRAQVGEPAPDFVLPDTAGKPLRLSGLRGRISAFMFVAMTCPPARMQLPRWSALAQKYRDEPVSLFVVYSRERHPGEPGFEDYRHTVSSQDKQARALELAALPEAGGLPVLVDDIGETVLARYGKVPNGAFVVDADGYIVFKSTWADAEKIGQVIEGLLAPPRATLSGL